MPVAGIPEEERKLFGKNLKEFAVAVNDCTKKANKISLLSMSSNGLEAVLMYKRYYSYLISKIKPEIVGNVDVVTIIGLNKNTKQ